MMEIQRLRGHLTLAPRMPDDDWYMPMPPSMHVLCHVTSGSTSVTR